LSDKILITRELEELGLESDSSRGRITGHLKKLNMMLNDPHTGGTLRILDTCRCDNGRVFLVSQLLNSFVHIGESKGACASFIPAAGAASRYMAALEPLRKALEKGDTGAVGKEWSELEKYYSVLPERLIRSMSEVVGGVRAADYGELAGLFASPKALLPCGLGGKSFFQYKLAESFGPFNVHCQIFVIPPGKEPDFQTGVTEGLKDKVVFIEQGGRFSTLRFAEDGSPVRDTEGRLSVVPAGHGALAALFPEIRQRFPEVETLFIRNIDNVYEQTDSTKQTTEDFLRTHKKLLALVNSIRKGLSAKDEEGLRRACKVAETTLSALETRSLNCEERGFLKKLSGTTTRPLWELLFLLFQTPPPEGEQLFSKECALLQGFYNRPVNLLGQVRNRGTDRGGSPVVVETDSGAVSVCLERPHASPEDQRETLDNPEIATHFNPVFVAAEATKNPPGLEEETPFWIMASKTWQGKKVVYYETVLYELLGNSMLANCVFVEVPGSIFCPRKTLSDTLLAAKA